MHDIEKIVTRFRESGLKITPQRVSIFKLLQGRTKSHHKVVGQIFYESDRVGDDNFNVSGKPQPAAGRVQRGKKPAFGGHIAFGQGVEQG